MNILLSCIGKRGYIADYFRDALPGGSRIIGTSNTSWTPGFASCDEAVVLPPIASNEYVPALLETCRRHEVRGLLSLFDLDVHRLSAHRDDFLAANVVPVLPGRQIASIAFDKLETWRVLSAAEINVPVTTGTLQEAGKWLEEGRLAFPLVVKPRCGFGSANTFVARNEAELEVFFHYAPDMIIQQFMKARALNVDGLGDLRGKTVAVVPWEKLLSRMGETERSVTIEAPDLVALGSRLIDDFGIIGPFDADFFRDDDDRLWVLELNLRFGGGYPVTHLAGADFPRMIVEFIRGQTIAPPDYVRGVTMMKRLQVIPGPPLDPAHRAQPA